MNDPKQLVSSLYDRLNRRDTSVLEQSIAVDLVDHTSHGEFRGLDAHRGHVLASFEAFPDLRFDVDEVLAEGDRVVARGRLGGTHRGPFLGAPPTGRAFSIGWIAVYRVEGGKIAERWLQGDDLGMMLQLGLMKPPGAP